MVVLKMVQMEILDDETNVRSTNSTSSVSEFSKKDGIKYCLSCGSECLCDAGTCECGKDTFLNNNSSELLGGYINLAKNDRLKVYYYKTRYSKSIVKMNEKRIIQQLMQHKNGVDIKKETVDKIYAANVNVNF